MSKIGILVVYVFNEQTQALFDIHLDRIRRHTTGEYTIFAAAHKLSKNLRDYVDSQPEIEIVDCEVPKTYSVRDEHSHCLERLAQAAFSKGCTHCVCLHLDSFPVVNAWFEILQSSMEQKMALACITPNGYSAGLCWSREFQESYSPRMLLSDDENAGPEFVAFKDAHPELDHVETGLGFIFLAWRKGLSWQRIETDHGQKIYGGLLFHMVGATFRTWVDAQPIRPETHYRLAWFFVRPLSKLFPAKMSRVIRSLFIDKDRASRDGSFRTKSKETAALMANPEVYVEELILGYKGPRFLPD